MSTVLECEQQLYTALLELGFKYPVANEWLKRLPDWLCAIKNKERYAHAPYYQSLIDKLPTVTQEGQCLTGACVGASVQWSSDEQKTANALLRQLAPWRKGGFCFGALHIDTEWRSDLKWERIAPFITLKDKRVLDVGGGCGYHGFRMVGAGAKMVVVLDPSCLFYYQFLAVRHLMGKIVNADKKSALHFVPAALEDLPMGGLYHAVFCMGVLYHRKSPFECLEQLKAQLLKGGELILETLVVDGDETTVLVPQDRYAKMNNVYCLPSVAALTLWLHKVGFVDIRCVDVSITTHEEQRATEWMTYQSLADFLDPNDDSKTCEGYPRPKRAVMIATKP